jgi:ABC-type phosphate/phosphonate transport system substrate-binding protein
MTNKKIVTCLISILFLTTALAGCLNNNDDDKLGSLVIAYEIQSDYDNIDENPQQLADYLSEELNYDVSLYSVDSEGAMIEALRFGNADIALMDSGAAWVGWQQYGLDALGADQKNDGRTYYNAHAWVKADSEMADAHLDDNPYTDPFALLSGKTSCHTGWLKSAGMLLPMGFLIGHGYANVIGDPNDVETIRNTIFEHFNENASIPDSGTPYYGYEGAIKCLSDGTGDVAFAKDSTVDTFCDNELSTDNKDWCLSRDQYIALPAFGKSPSHPVMYNPELIDPVLLTQITEVLIGMGEDSKASEILEKVLNTPGIVATNAEEHLSSYSSLISNIPGISAYYNDKFTINGTISPTIEKVRVAYEVKADYDNIDENPQILADYLSEVLGVPVELYSVDSEGAIIEALRFGNADQKSDGRTYYNAHAWVKADSEMAVAHLDDDPDTDPFSLLEGKTSCHTGWLKSAGMLLPMGYLIGNDYAPVLGDDNDIDSLRNTIYGFFSSDASIPDSGTPYYSYSGAVKCLSDGTGDVAFAKDSTIDSYCGNDEVTDNEDWCLERDQYIALDSFGQAPSHPVMYNPSSLDVQTRTAILNALMSLNYETYVENYTVMGNTYTGCYDISVHVIDEEAPKNTCGSEILTNVLNTPGLVRVTSQEHLGSYSELISNIPGISSYYNDKFQIED